MQIISNFLNCSTIGFQQAGLHFKLSISKEADRTELAKQILYYAPQEALSWKRRAAHLGLTVIFGLPVVNAVVLFACNYFITTKKADSEKDKDSKKSNPFKDLNSELQLHIMSFLNEKEVTNAALVCKAWNTLITDDPRHPLKQQAIASENVELLRARWMKEAVFHRKKDEKEIDISQSFLTIAVDDFGRMNSPLSKNVKLEFVMESAALSLGDLRPFMINPESLPKNEHVCAVLKLMIQKLSKLPSRALWTAAKLHVSGIGSFLPWQVVLLSPEKYPEVSQEKWEKIVSSEAHAL